MHQHQEHENRIFHLAVGWEKEFASAEIDADLSGTSDFTTLLKPFRKAFKVLGSWPRNADHFIMRLNAWNGFTLFILHFYTAHKFFNWMTVVKYTNSIFNVFEQLTSIVRTAVVAITFDLRFFKHKSLMKTMQDIENFPTLNPHRQLGRLRLHMKILLIACLAFVALQCILACSFMVYKSTDNYVNWLFYGDSAGNTPGAIIRTVMILDWALYLYLIVCNECFAQAFYVCLCLAAKERISDYNDYLTVQQKRHVVKEAVQVQELYKLHSNLSSIVEGLEDNFSFPAFLWIVSIIFNVCVKLEGTVSGIKNGYYGDFGYIIVDMVYFTTTFVLMCNVASEIGEQKQAPIIAVTKIAEDGDISDSCFQQESQLLLTKINTRMMRLTGWGCFELNKSFMITILGAFATYTIIILQMS